MIAKHPTIAIILLIGAFQAKAFASDAVEGIQVGDIRAHLEFLADDLLEGREARVRRRDTR